MKCELYNDNFQNFKRYGLVLPKDNQMSIFDMNLN